MRFTETRHQTNAIQSISVKHALAATNYDLSQNIFKRLDILEVFHLFKMFSQWGFFFCQDMKREFLDNYNGIVLCLCCAFSLDKLTNYNCFLIPLCVYLYK